MLTALFGIDDGSLNLAINLLILVLVIVWLSLVYWTWADARRRVSDPILVATATAASLVPFIGTVIYSILRPPEFLADAREREVETQASELRMRHLAAQSCPRCEHPIERSWLRCPDCQHRLKDPCRSCNRPVDPRWSICPYCETPLRRSTSPTEPTRSRSRPAPGADGDEGEASSKRRKAASADRAGERAARAERQERSSRPERAEASDDGKQEGTRPRRRSSSATS